MFHWICPECGREIAPQAKECPACEPQPEPVAAAAPAGEPEPAPAVDPLPVAIAAPLATPPAVPAFQRRPAEVMTETPVAPAPPELRSGLAEPEPAAGGRVPHAPLRPPQPAKLLTAGSPAITPAEPSVPESAPALPEVASAGGAEPRLAPPCEFAASARARMRSQAGTAAPLGREVKAHISLPGPTLPHELTSLEAAGLAKILVAKPASAPVRRGGWVLSVVVASGMLAVVLSAVFYTLPGLAEPAKPAATPPAPPAAQPAAFAPPAISQPAEHPLAAALEVTGIRFVTDLPGRPPQIHYMVVNHANTSVNGVVVTVVLRSAQSQEPLTQFSFRAPALGPYEAKEMVSGIQRMGPGVELPGWRALKTEIRIEP